MLCTAGDITSKEGGQVQKLVDLLFCGRSGVGTPETLVPCPCLGNTAPLPYIGCGCGCGCYRAGRG